ncbi:MAG: hypothetical protein KIT27_01545 [Legionellales bacterium]|nr:hypothetical protein [Legionellales bacterium]
MPILQSEKPHHIQETQDYLIQVAENQLDAILNIGDKRNIVQTLRDIIYYTPCGLPKHLANLIKANLYIEAIKLATLTGEIPTSQFHEECRWLLKQTLPPFLYHDFLNRYHEIQRYLANQNNSKQILLTLFTRTQNPSLNDYLSKKIQNLENSPDTTPDFIDFIRHNFPSLLKLNFWHFMAETYNRINSITGNEGIEELENICHEKINNENNLLKLTRVKKISSAHFSHQLSKKYREDPRSLANKIYYAIITEENIFPLTLIFLEIYKAGTDVNEDLSLSYKHQMQNYVNNLTLVLNTLSNTELETINGKLYSHALLREQLAEATQVRYETEYFEQNPISPLSENTTHQGLTFFAQLVSYFCRILKQVLNIHLLASPPESITEGNNKLNLNTMQQVGRKSIICSICTCACALLENQAAFEAQHKSTSCLDITLSQKNETASILHSSQSETGLLDNAINSASQRPPDDYCKKTAC